MSSYIKLSRIIVDSVAARWLDLKHLQITKSVYIFFCFRPRVIVVRLFSTTNPYTAKDGVSKSKGGSKEVSKKYSSTLFLPKTSFPVRVEGKKRTEKDAEIARSCGFESQYQWQRDNRRPGGKLSQSNSSYHFAAQAPRVTTSSMMDLPTPMGSLTWVTRSTR